MAITIYHNHRILPGHMGGKYTEDNVIKLTISEHATWHYELWVYYGHWEDYYAWQCLSKQIGRDELLFKISSEQGKKRKGSTPWNKDKTGIYSEENKKKISRKGSKHSIESKQKMSNSHKGSIRNEKQRENISKSLKGKPKSEATKKKLSEASKNWWNSRNIPK